MKVAKEEGVSQKADGIPLELWVDPAIDRAGPKGAGEFFYVDIGSIDRASKRIVDATALPVSKAPSRAKQVLKANDVLVSMTRPNLNAVAIVPPHLDGAIGSTGFHVLRAKHADPRFLFYAVQTHEFIGTLCLKVQGALYPAVRPTDISSFCLPPFSLGYQRQLVARIEELFSELEAGEESLRVARRQLGVYRQSLLKQAFEGKLTEKWRTQNPAKLESPAALIDAIQERSRSAKFKANDDHKIPSWSYRAIDELTESVTSGSRGWADYYADAGSIFIRAQNLNQDFLNLADIAYVQLPESAEGKRTRVKYGDLLITITGANTTKAGWVSTQLDEAYVSQHVALCRPISDELSPFLYRYIIADAGGRKKLTADAYGAGKPGLNLDNVRSLTVPLPSLPEQHEIVRLLDEQFEVIEQNEREIDAALQRSEALRQAILKKAFTGRLIAQDPADEPASALLARLRAAPAVRVKSHASALS